MIHKKLTLEMWGETEDDLSIVLEEMTLQINDGFTSGHFNSDEHGFNWSLDDVESADKPVGDPA